MSRSTLLFAMLLTSVLPGTLAWGQAGKSGKVITDLKLAQDDEEFQVQGEYVSEQKGIQVISLGEQKYRVVQYDGGLPGAGWDKTSRKETEGDRALVKQLTEGYKKTLRQSPTLGAEPPEGSVVLFDGTEATFKKHWNEAARIEPIAGSDRFLLKEGATSQDLFQSYKLHLEFLLPFMPHARGQGRGNSGVYHQGRYETQVLDSFGLQGADNECGGLYQIKAPDVNACFPPLSWQTYDVELTSAKYDESGKKIANARITVHLNGILIHEDLELPANTAGNPYPESAQPGPIYLQNHRDPVRFRNIWVIPK